MMKYNDVEILDTFAEAWELEVVRLVITAISEEIALGGAYQFVGAAGSGELGSRINAGIERSALPHETPDGRPGVIVSLTSTPKERPNYIKELALRFHLATLIPTCAVFDCKLKGVKTVNYDMGADLKELWKGDDSTVMINGREMCSVPTLPGDYKFEKIISIATKGSDGHLVCYGKDTNAVVLAVMAAKKALEGVDGVCPMGFGLEQVYREKDYVPALRGKIKKSKVPEGVGAILNLLVFGVDTKYVEKALSYALKAACQVPGVMKIGAMNFNGEFGPYKFFLKDLIEKY
jgi:formylmethanofuran--tetrahydromethanopterin N-formyltransferase